MKQTESTRKRREVHVAKRKRAWKQSEMPLCMLGISQTERTQEKNVNEVFAVIGAACGMSLNFLIDMAWAEAGEQAVWQQFARHNRVLLINSSIFDIEREI